MIPGGLPLHLLHERQERIDLLLERLSCASRAEMRVVDIEIPISRDIQLGHLHIAGDLECDSLKNLLRLDRQERGKVARDVATTQHRIGRGQDERDAAFPGDA